MRGLKRGKQQPCKRRESRNTELGAPGITLPASDSAARIAVVSRKVEQPSEATALTLSGLRTLMQRSERIRSQRPKDKNKLCALHAPEVECIGKGKAESPTGSA